MGLFKFGPASMAGVSGAMDYWTKQRDDEMMRQKEMADWQNKQTFANNLDMQNWQKQNETQQAQQEKTDKRRQIQDVVNFKMTHDPTGVWGNDFLSGALKTDDPNSIKMTDEKAHATLKQMQINDRTKYNAAVTKLSEKYPEVAVANARSLSKGEWLPADDLDVALGKAFERTATEKQAKLDAENKISIQPGPQGSDIVTRGKSMTVVRQPAPTTTPLPFSATPVDTPSGSGWYDQRGMFHANPRPQVEKPAPLPYQGQGNGPGRLPTLPGGTSPWGKPTPKGGFGAQRDGHLHQGNDYTTYIGAPVPAEMDGKVLRVGNQPNSAGRYVVVQYEDGTQRKYMHLSGAMVRPGQSFKAGTNLALAGRTGNAEAKKGNAVLHVEVWANGKAIDPKIYYGGGGQQQQPTQAQPEGLHVGSVVQTYPDGSYLIIKDAKGNTQLHSAPKTPSAKSAVAQKEVDPKVQEKWWAVRDKQQAKINKQYPVNEATTVPSDTDKANLKKRDAAYSQWYGMVWPAYAYAFPRNTGAAPQSGGKKFPSKPKKSELEQLQSDSAITVRHK